MYNDGKHINAVRSAWSYLLSSYLHRPVIYGMPPAISFELTNCCNLRCPHCDSGSGKMTRMKGYMDPGLFGRVTGELRKYLFNINLYFQGEPMMHPRFFSFPEHCKGLSSTVSTNGHFLDAVSSGKIVRSGLKKLIISLDGFDQDVYSSYRVNGDINIVMQGIRNVAEAKRQARSGLKIIIQFLVNRKNEHQIPLVKEFARECGVSLSLKSMQLNDPGSVAEWLPSDERFRRYRLGSQGAGIKSDLPDRCARLWFNPVVTWDGKVVPCCFDKDADYIMGDLGKSSFREIWYGKAYTNFRQQVLTGRDRTDICRNCTSGMRSVRT